MSSSTTTSTRDRALALLGAGCNQEQCASALGVEVSRISQLLSEDTFSKEVTELRFKNLHDSTARDKKYDALEDIVLEKLTSSVETCFKHADLLKTAAVINAMKRRGASAPEMLQPAATVVTLVMPTKIVNKFSVNQVNQVIQAGSQELITIQSSTLLDQVKKDKEVSNGSQRTIEHKSGEYIPVRQKIPATTIVG